MILYAAFGSGLDGLYRIHKALAYRAGLDSGEVVGLKRPDLRVTLAGISTVGVAPCHGDSDPHGRGRRPSFPYCGSNFGARRVSGGLLHHDVLRNKRKVAPFWKCREGESCPIQYGMRRV